MPKEKAESFLQDRAGRVKRDIDEECRETDGCWIEEILEYGVTDVVTILFKYVLLRVLSNFLEDWISCMCDLKGDGKTYGLINGKINFKKCIQTPNLNDRIYTH